MTYINKSKKINYIYTEKFKTFKENITKSELKDIFNRKFYKTIMKIEKTSVGGYQNESSAL